MMCFIDARLDFDETESRAIGGGALRGGLRLFGGQQRRRADGGVYGGNGERALKQPAPSAS